ncbi:MAG: 16S rRNA (guanine(527)-N(7))-methyltransferase RsmG [Gammaproteobacteria bacterium]|jgi:16S rRNA (guanine527-N7)-methyltransferase|nr:16S rRNA (guanine(527)-N(7))-methyltransferase RsmG [Chromatiales bacterium]MDP6675846.1 16S rRNA (guanine(527)-N(7))-methyltransferase RsmG [Gammaproteobacteria bacterium]
MSASATELDLEALLKTGLATMQVPVEPELVQQFTRLLRLLVKWNRAFNLTAVRDPKEMVARHILDSLSARPFLTGKSVLDVGTGAGFPGLPLALVEPQRHFTLLDSGGKKVRFVRHVLGELALTNVLVEHLRVETFAPADLYDVVISRAFSSLGVFVRHCGGLVATGGCLLAMKGRYPDGELASVPGTWEVADVARLEVPGLAGERHMVVMRRHG